MSTVKELTICESDDIVKLYPPARLDCPGCLRGGSITDEHGRRDYTCSRQRGHKGPHVAYGTNGPVASWPK